MNRDEITKPLVSIVLPSYNGERYLEESVKSVQAQTLTDWELIIVDDCSNDNTLNLARQFALNDSRIRVIHNKTNQKLPNSLNIGFREAKGDYLTWTSDDNCYLPDALEKMYQRLAADEKIFMVCADCEFIDSDGNKDGFMSTYNEDMMLFDNSIGACFMYKREVLDEVGEYDSNGFCIEDFDYWQRILKKYGHIERIPERLYLYRRHSGSLTVQKHKLVLNQRARLMARNFEDIIKKFDKRKKFIYRAYLEMRLGGYCPDNIYRRAAQMMPEIVLEKPYDDKCSYLLFGAGKFGKKLQTKLGERVVGFIDNDNEKIGTEFAGKPVFSLTDARMKFPDQRIMLAVAPTRAYDMIVQLQKDEPTEYTTCIDVIGD